MGIRLCFHPNFSYFQFLNFERLWAFGTLVRQLIYQIGYIRYQLSFYFWRIGTGIVKLKSNCLKSVIITPYIRSRMHCVKSVQIWSFFWSVFSCLRTEYRDLREYSVRIQENTDQERFHIWTFFTQ